jgi:glycosyltransferase involved in cell wall biosynthesis
LTSIAIIIPALNEAGNIGQLVTDIHATLPADVIVVDNASSDATAREAAHAHARVISETRRGYGSACAAGVVAADNADILVFMDGDRCFSPADLPLLLEPILTGQADLVLGSRELGHIAPGAMFPQQRFGNWLASRLMNFLYGLSITDLGPFRAIRKQLLLDLDMHEMTYGWPTEMIVKAARQGFRIEEIPVSYRARLIGISKVSGTLKGSLLAGWHIITVTLRYVRRK